MSQLSFDFDAPIEEVNPPTTDHSPNLTQEDKDRLSGQNKIILDRLMQGPATGIELMKLCNAMNISARISNVRAYLAKRGMCLRSERISGGTWKYWIEKSYA